jgi:hypothetical protein
MATAAQNGGFRPVHEAHAIEQVIATIQFDRPLDGAPIRAADQALVRYEQALPGRSEIRAMGIQFGPAGVSAVTPQMTDAPNGIARSVSDGRGVVVKELRIDRQSLMFRTQVYTRWDAVWAEAREYFGTLLGLVGDVNVGGYGLAYVDKFIWTGAPGTCRPTDLIRTDAPFVSRASLDATDLWHCHSGRFSIVDGRIKRLENVDFDCIDEPASTLGGEPQRAVRISTQFTDLLNQPGAYQWNLAAREAMPELDAEFVTLHNLLKNVFGQIVNDDAARKVGLHAG